MNVNMDDVKELHRAAQSPRPEFVAAVPGVMRAWAYKLRAAHIAAEKHANRWRTRRDELKKYIEDNASLYPSEQLRRDKLADDWELNDAFGDYKFWSDEMNRIAALIQAERNLRDLLPRG